MNSNTIDPDYYFAPTERLGHFFYIVLTFWQLCAIM